MRLPESIEGWVFLGVVALVAGLIFFGVRSARRANGPGPRDDAD